MQLNMANKEKHERELAELKRSMQEQIDNLQMELDNSEENRLELKQDLEEKGEVMIQLEQELYELKSIELDLLKTIKELELKIETIHQDKADRLIYLEEKVEELLNIIE